ncbi:MAG: hypothetical protein A2066_10415 [Bacteroidetes bacterium GWB2_41_8]|nr:MAG: hypothetical protein A2066_10415 [Bacteroidetes bacterium GWB2_41_8]
MSRYEKYKPSEVVWIGDIPHQWKIKRLKDLVNPKITDGPHETPELVDDEDGVPFISAEAITENGINYEARGGNISVEQDRIYSLKCKPKRDDIFIVKSGSTTGRIGYVDTDLNFNIWSPLALVRSNNKTSSRFLYHFLSSDCIQRQIQNSWSFGTQPNIGMGVIERLRLAIPEYIEQLAIANYLDYQTQKIDRLIANKKAQAEKLKELRQIEINNAVTKGLNPNIALKDSSIEWLGEIPKHWEVKRLKNVADIKYGLGQPPEEKEDGLPLIRATNVERGKINDKDLIFVDPEDVPYDRDPVLKENDIIVVRSGAYTADSAIIPKKYEGSIAGYDMVVRVNKSFPLFISFCLLSNYLLVNQLFLERLRAAQPHLNKEELSKSLVLIPPLHEQVQIANYLQNRTESIDKLLNNIDTQIEKLQELRKIKIYEAVTGKIKVNAYAEKTA